MSLFWTIAWAIVVGLLLFILIMIITTFLFGVLFGPKIAASAQNMIPPGIAAQFSELFNENKVSPASYDNGY